MAALLSKCPHVLDEPEISCHVEQRGCLESSSRLAARAEQPAQTCQA